jgi:hypothetical protein
MSDFPRVKDQSDPLAHQVGMSLKDSYFAKEREKNTAIDMWSAGLNSYGEFTIVGKGGQVIRIHDDERVRLATYLLRPLMYEEGEQMKKEDAEMVDRCDEGKVPVAFKSRVPELMKSGKPKGIIARV